jgi:hypothetical protein
VLDWQQLPQAAGLDGAGVTLFWRAWGVTSDGCLTRCFVTATDQRWGPGWQNIATCQHRGRHTVPAPAPDCFCGWHVLTTEAAVWAFVRSRHRGSPWAVGPVAVWGSVLPSNVPNDPPETRRVAAAAVAGPLALSPQARPYGEALTARYGFPVTTVWLPCGSDGR